MRGLFAAALAAVALVVVAGCGSSGGGSGSGGSGSSAGGKVLKVAVTPGYEPWTFEVGGRWQGINIEFGDALAKQLGMRLEYENVNFDATIPGLVAHRYDMALATMFDTPQREQQTDFVDYTNGASGVIVSADDNGTYNTTADLCGHTVGVLRGSVDQTTLGAQRCSGPAVKLSIFNDYASVVLALSSKRIDAAAGDFALMGLRAQREPQKFKKTGIRYAEGVVGITLPRHSPLEARLVRATQAIMDSGQLERIHAKWGAPGLALHHATVNSGS